MKEHTADHLTWAAVLGWIVSHVTQINEWLQMAVLVIAAISGLYSFYLRWKHRNTPR